MELTLLAVAAIVLIVIAALFSRRLGIATPLILVALGAGLSFIPSAPDIPLEPEWILIVVLPPLLYSAAVNVPLVDFRRNLTPIFGLGVFAVVLSAFATGAILYLALPSLDFAAAVALGAVISPTDAVAATAIAKRVGLPHRLVTVLEGESLINDASALVLLRTAIAAIGGSVSIGGAIGQFAWAVAGGLIVGLILGGISVLLRAKFGDDVIGTALSFVVPFVAYIGAEELRASGVIAVVAAGLLIGHQSARRFSARARLSERINWRTIQFVLENGVFLLMGYQLSDYLAHVIADGYGVWVPLGLGLLLVVALIVVRTAFVAPLIAFLRFRDRRTLARGADFDEHAEAVRSRLRSMKGSDARAAERQERLEQAVRRRSADLGFLEREGLDWRGGAVIAWAGMRGVVTVAAAQALPASVPYRSELILVAFVVAVVSLALSGLTLPPLIRRLRIRGTDAEALAAEREELLAEITAVAEASLDRPTEDGQAFEPEVVEEVRRETAALGKAARERLTAGSSAKAEQLRRLRTLVLEAQRAALLDARSSGAYSSATIDEAQALLDAVELRGHRPPG